MPHWKRSTFSSSPLLSGGICSSAKSCTTIPLSGDMVPVPSGTQIHVEMGAVVGQRDLHSMRTLGGFKRSEDGKWWGKIPRGPYCWWFYLLYPMGFLGHEPLTSSTFFSSSYKWIYNHDWAWLLGPHIPKLCGFSSPPPSSCTARSGWWQISPKWGFLLAVGIGEKIEKKLIWVIIIALFTVVTGLQLAKVPNLQEIRHGRVHAIPLSISIGAEIVVAVSHSEAGGCGPIERGATTGVTWLGLAYGRHI